MTDNKEPGRVSDEKNVTLYCENGHKKTVSESYWANWKASHGPGTVMMCRKCNDTVAMLPMSEIPQESFRADILAKAAKIDAEEAAEGKYFRDLYKGNESGRQTI